MSVLKTFVEKQSYYNYNYNGTLDINKYDLYVPIILNKKYICICGNPYTPGFSCSLITRTTKVMSGIHTAFTMAGTFWKTPKRIGVIKARKSL